MSTPPIHIETFCLGDWMTNCYVVHPPESRETQPDRDRAPGGCWLIDAGFNPQVMIRYIQDRQLTPEKMILTHAHVDHIAGLQDIRQAWPDIPILIHEAERDFLADAALNLSIALADPVVAPEATDTLAHGQTFDLAGIGFEIRHTPGHSPGGITLYQPDAKVALVGDALFAGSIGRTDFPTSDHHTLIAAIKAQLLSLPDDTRVLSGHGPETTIGHERASNPFL